jgi:undecaprenyl-diphosphatase
VVVAAVLLAATALLFLGERWGRKERGIGVLRARDALGVGVAQALALLPGVSRSASTIAGGMLLGMDRVTAARFSFLLSIPVMAAAGAWETARLLREPDPGRHLPALATGFAVAAVVGYATIHWLLRYLARSPLTVFAWYRILAGVALLGLALSRA